MSEMLQQLKQAKDEAIHMARTGEGGNPDGTEIELPEGTSPLEARTASADTGEETPTEVSEPVQEEQETLIRIGDREFKTQAEAIKYAEKLEYENLVAQSYNQGIRDSLQARTPEVPAEPVEDKFEEEFYANPKETLKKVQAQARDEAVAVMRQEQMRENMWAKFLNEYPDIDREDAELMLQRNWDTLGKMTDLTKAQALLAQKTRAEYQRMADKVKPRTDLARGKSQAVSPGTGSGPRVTPTKKDDTPLDFVAQMKKLKSHG